MTTPEQLAFDNQLFVQQLDAALINAHLPPDTLRVMLQQVNEQLSCLSFVGIRETASLQ